MGVSGCGKTTVGRFLARRLDWEFYDADDFHPAGNISKMTEGIPLDDDDRRPWLAALHDLISRCLIECRPGVLACSALKEKYRRDLLQDNPNVQVVYLMGSFDLIRSRISARSGHYMKPGMLQGQFDALEEPLDALTVPVSMSMEEVAAVILANLK
jgi:gluconokinase